MGTTVAGRPAAHPRPDGLRRVRCRRHWIRANPIRYKYRRPPAVAAATARLCTCVVVRRPLSSIMASGCPQFAREPFGTLMAGAYLSARQIGAAQLIDTATGRCGSCRRGSFVFKQIR